ncbi:hypothetical protein F1188_06320 [Roseospira marina]|uniref:GGDEF domain-containing protein n=1 Tax=Roseospira marina TaxID=140057 RepID=A0A5M6IFH1_9PROT|nr:hypothetical protein [Roseospira marina]KAA5606475.1 hypothetical protein F1188_06320 [Roseospira marina]MBB4314104.1 hypothetical protein [Roseospira marina]MBB5087265.1 hypothetical protein [Roseospira marina]
MTDDIGRSPPPQPVFWRRDRRQGGGAESGDWEYARAADAYGRLADDDGRDVDDTVTMFGIPPAELTPAVRRAIGRLVAEVDRLRQELDARPSGPLPAPHPFESEGAEATAPPEVTASEAESVALCTPEALDEALRARLDVLAAGGAAPAIAVLSLANGEDLRARYGPAALRHATSALAEAIAAIRAPDEILGWTRGGSLAVVLPFDGQMDHLWSRVRALAQGGEVEVAWHADTLRTYVRLGVHVCRRGDDPAEAVALAEQMRRRVVRPRAETDPRPDDPDADGA